MPEDHSRQWDEEQQLWESIRSELDTNPQLGDVVELPRRPDLMHADETRHKEDAPRMAVIDKRDGKQFEIQTEDDWQEAKRLMGLP